jgi:hypothetical protein
LRPAGETLREELKDHRQHPNDLTFDITPIGCGQPAALAARFCSDYSSARSDAGAYRAVSGVGGKDRVSDDGRFGIE